MNYVDAAAVAFVCPWCPITVVGFGDAAEDARRLIEHHLDEHLSQAPTFTIPQPRQPPVTSSDDTYAGHLAA
jgi:hypothetical protein